MYIFRLFSTFTIFLFTIISTAQEGWMVGLGPTGTSSLIGGNIRAYIGTSPVFCFGAHYNINRVLLFAEFKGVIGELSDEFFTLGAIVLLKKPQKKLHHE